MSLFLIAEIGINHNGDIDIAKKLIDGSKSAGFDAVKFQKRDINKVYSKKLLDSPRRVLGEKHNVIKRGFRIWKKDYDEIDSYCKKNILWSASSWDTNSQTFLSKYDLKFNKIASPMLGNFPLIKQVADEKKKTFISTGMSTLKEIDEVVEIFRKRIVILS